MEQFEITRERIDAEIALIKREKLERQQERQRKNSTGPKTPQGKAVASANGKARAPVWSFNGTSAQADRFVCRPRQSVTRAGIAAVLTEAGLPFTKIKLTGHWQLKVRVGCIYDRGWVKVHITGKAQPWCRYDEIVGAYCQSVLEGPPA
jgi:hypothetical protein